ncbi:MULTISPECIES: WXG100 family type VII secretion target [Streptomyces]|uniref:WXG100 family type VII secretion target n=1 Tax=Streptomyces eurythermus TaxID=42237 RepID=A0ABW6YZC2_9ACTN|nr:WXG100 family type VII secretion target [Streptomyces sp. DSM 40868]QIS75483.1 type VII secretion protein [Streptomyces sp. DSM 40868]
MTDVSVGYDGVQHAATQLLNGHTDMIEKLQSLKTVVDQLVGGEFRTQLASPKFQESYQQWTTGAQNMIQGLEGMAGFLNDVVRGHQELDQRLAGGAGH